MRACAALLLLLSACTAAAIEDGADTDDDGTAMPTPDPDPDPGSDPDPGPDPDPGAVDTCPPDSFGTIDSLKDPSATIDRMDPNDPDSPAVRQLSGLLDPYSELELGLWDGWGAFLDSPAAAGDYLIEGDDADPASCGLCLEVGVTKEDTEHRMVATAGAVSIASVDGNLTGNATDVTLEEFDEDDQPVTGGCRARITRLVFDAPLEPLF
jgi:hypothetical protein